MTAHRFAAGHGSVTVDVFQWAKDNPVLGVLVTKKKPGTARKYLGALRTYWVDVLSKRFGSFVEWVESVKKAQSERDFETQTSWAKELEEWVLSQTELDARTRRGYVAAVQSFLELKIGRQNARNYKFTYETPEEKENGEPSESDTTTVDYDEIRQLVHTAKSKRDRALILTILSGLGVSEFLDFNKKWFTIYEILKSRTTEKRWKDDIEPVRIPKGDKNSHLVRKKRGVRFYTMLVDDQIDALADLLEERESELGRPLVKDDSLFVTTRSEPMSDHRAQEQIRYLRAQSGVENPERLRIHEMGRDTLQTLLGNLELKDREKNYGDFCLGHTVDPLKYDKSPWTADGENGIRELFQKLRPRLNLITKRGEPKTEIVKEVVDTEAREKLKFYENLFLATLSPEQLRQLAALSSTPTEVKKAIKKRLRDFSEEEIDKLLENGPDNQELLEDKSESGKSEQ